MVAVVRVAAFPKDRQKPNLSSFPSSSTSIAHNLHTFHPTTRNYFFHVLSKPSGHTWVHQKSSLCAWQKYEVNRTPTESESNTRGTRWAKLQDEEEDPEGAERNKKIRGGGCVAGGNLKVCETTGLAEFNANFCIRGVPLYGYNLPDWSSVTKWRKVEYHSDVCIGG